MEEFPAGARPGHSRPQGSGGGRRGRVPGRGQWPFASGGPNPDFVTANCIVFEGEAPRRGPSGAIETAVVLLTAEEVEFLDTWHVVGMRGSDSCDFAARDVFVPDERVTAAAGRVERIRHPALLCSSPGGPGPRTCVGRRGHRPGRLDDITELAETKRSALKPSLRLGEDVMFRHDLGENALRFEAARALLRQIAAEVDQAGRPVPGRTARS